MTQSDKALDPKVLDDVDLHGWAHQRHAFLRQHAEIFTNEVGNEILLVAWRSAKNPIAIRYILEGPCSHAEQQMTPMEAERLIHHLQAALGQTAKEPTGLPSDHAELVKRLSKVADHLAEQPRTPSEDEWLATLREAITALKRAPRPVVCRVLEYRHSSGFPDYYVSVERNGKSLTPYKSKSKGRVEYSVAEWEWLLNDGPKPDILTYDDTIPSDATPPASQPIGKLDEQIKHMVGRFLGWKLPENFSPDGGISFKREFNENTPYPMKHEPVGTNLLDAIQAEAMVRHMIKGLATDALEEQGGAPQPIGGDVAKLVEALKAIPEFLTDMKHTGRAEMTEAAKPTLWCVNIIGPDDVVAVASYLEAIWQASAFNSWWVQYRTIKPLHEQLDARMWAAPIEWPHSAESHAESLASPPDEYAWLAARPALVRAERIDR
ncbi:hypothetical protein [Allomesorhizobium alhagi]|uniref:Uncharacterized protein n=1 Tax=Mesorhizobium alhagi CCNWXJ12-2 TaxID=1107882 RepID=H0HQZ1_9HYPH|nr:hypothetical protein [Mesorhizobium alhagi]EHK56853.1 hypothetical protein MAXJ12_12867 [Mesorhizobium alhagi CCNWXJ12-2]